MNLLDKIKRDVAKSGSNKSKFFYVREGGKARIRFLQDVNDGMEVIFHDSFKEGINVPCAEIYGKHCKHCGDDNLRTRPLYLWNVWNYEISEVQLFMYAVNSCSPLPALLAMYETYGTITDRDYVISTAGKQTNKTYSVVPMDKNKFRNDRAKPFGRKVILEMLKKAYPDDSDETLTDDEEELFAKKDTSNCDNDEKKESSEYSNKSAKELYKLCREREIEAEIKKPTKYYINLLEEYDKAQDEWGDDSDDWEENDEWENEEDELSFR